MVLQYFMLSFGWAFGDNLPLVSHFIFKPRREILLKIVKLMKCSQFHFQLQQYKEQGCQCQAFVPRLRHNWRQQDRRGRYHCPWSKEESLRWRVSILMLALCVDAVGPFSKSYSSTKTVPSVTGILLSFCLIWVFPTLRSYDPGKEPNTHWTRPYTAECEPFIVFFKS